MITKVDNFTRDMFGAGLGRPVDQNALSVSERVKKHRAEKQKNNILTITIDLDFELKQSITNYCKKNNLNRSKFIAALISEHLPEE